MKTLVNVGHDGLGKAWANCMNKFNLSRSMVLWLQRTVALLLLSMVGVVVSAQTISSGAVLSNGTVSIGVNKEGDLIYQGRGLTYVPTNGEALAPGCYCEGWGVGNKLTNDYGKAGRSFGIANLSVESFSATSSTAKSVVKVMKGSTAFLRVTHDYKPAPETPHLFQATVTVENISPSAVEAVYRRAMDWDVPPTTFSELVTIVTNGAPDVIYSSDNGFADGNPFSARSPILFSGEATNSGPGDHGALFDFNLGRLESGEKRIFFIYYGATANEPDALKVLTSIGAEVYSLGKPNTPSLTPPGSPNTFIFAFKGLGGSPVLTKDADLTVGALRLIDNGTAVAQSISTRVGNAGGKSTTKFNVSFYEGDPTKAGATLLGTKEVAGLAKGKFIDVQLDGLPSLTGKALYAVADPEKKITECTLLNNSVSILPAPTTPLGRITITPDAPKYIANSPVAFAVNVINNGSFTYKYLVAVTIKDGQNAVVQSFPVLETNDVAAGMNAALNQAWNAGLLVAGSYTVTADLLSVGKTKLSSNTAAFEIVGNANASANLGSKISTDKQAYLPSEQVRIVSRVSNETGNVLLNDLTAVTIVKNPDGTVRFTKTELLPQLSQNAIKDYSYGLPLSMAPAGEYRAELTIAAADGTLLSQSNSQFSVTATSGTGSGLTGTIAVSPKAVPAGDSLVLNITANNLGNSTLAELPLKVSIVDPSAQTVLSEFSYQSTLAVGSSYTAASSWVSNGVIGKDYVAVLSATVSGKMIVLAQDAFKLSESPIKLDIKQQAGGVQRILALASCVNHSRDRDEDDDEDDEDDEDDRDEDEGDGDYNGDDQEDGGCNDGDEDDDEGDGDGHDIDNDHDGDEGDHDGDDNDGETDCDDESDGSRHLVCAKSRARAIHATLHQMGMTHYVTTKRSTFKRALRSGLYNTYWISGSQGKLYGTLAAEVREAVYGGNTLILDATFADPNLAIEQAAGVHYLGLTTEQNLKANIAGPVFTAQQLATSGPASKLQLKGATQHATLTGLATTATPGITTQSYGQGRSVTFGFDLLKSRRAQSQWQNVLASGLQYATPSEPVQLTPGSLWSAKTTVGNLARAIDVDVKSMLPQGTRYFRSYPVGSYDLGTNTIQWAFHLAETQTKDLFLTLRVPSATGSYTLQTLVSTSKDGSTKLYGNPLTLPIKVVAASQNASNAINALKAFSLPTYTQQQLRNSLVSKLQQAVTQFNYNTRTGYTNAIGLLVQVTDQLGGLTAVDTAGVRQDVGRVLKEAQWRWTLTPPPPPSDDDDDDD